MKQTEQRFQVFVRVRPYTNKQTQQITALQHAASKKQGAKLSSNAYNFLSRFHPSDLRTLVKIQDNILHVVDNQYKALDRRYKPYHFNQIFSPISNNSSVFSQIQKNVQKLFQGFNFTIFTYGITGSGKTFTIFGSTKQEQQKGLCHLIYQYLFRRKKEIQTVTDNVVKFKFSFFEIYNQNVRDLSSNDNNKSLNVVQDSKGNTIVNDLIQYNINNLSQIYSHVNQGHSKRAINATNNNLYSSRSHALQLLQVEVENTSGYKNIAKLYIVDLAGSQKVQSNKNKCVIQGANINKSLLALANCITLLSTNKNINHIPYRDSKLTRILKQSLGGNANTLMITCISSNPFLIQETITTLNYANRASGIQKKISRNIVEPLSKTKQNMVLSSTPSKNKQIILPRKISQFDLSIVSKLLQDIRQNAIEKHQLQQLLKICKQSNIFQVQGAITVNQCQKVQLQNILKSYLKGGSQLTQQFSSVSKYQSQKKSQRASLKFQRRTRNNSLMNTIR